MGIDSPHRSISVAPLKYHPDLLYDLSGKVRAVGAEAMEESIYEKAEDEGWVKAEW